MIEASKVLEEINEFDINSETVLKLFLHNDKSDVAKSFFRSALLQYLDTDNIFRLYLLYYRLEEATVFNYIHRINVNGKIEEKTEYDMRTLRYSSICRTYGKSFF